MLPCAKGWPCDKCGSPMTGTSTLSPRERAMLDTLLCQTCIGPRYTLAAEFYGQWRGNNTRALRVFHLPLRVVLTHE